MINTYCCDDMKENIEKNKLLIYSDVFDEFGIRFHEDMLSYLVIRYCPWCGKILPCSKRDLWFDELEELGYDAPLIDDSIPKKYKSSEWWKNGKILND